MQRETWQGWARDAPLWHTAEGSQHHSSAKPGQAQPTLLCLGLLAGACSQKLPEIGPTWSSRGKNSPVVLYYLCMTGQMMGSVSASPYPDIAVQAVLDNEAAHTLLLQVSRGITNSPLTLIKIIWKIDWILFALGSVLLLYNAQLFFLLFFFFLI